MFSPFEVSNDVLLSLFQDWISLKEVVNLDSAFCNKIDRVSFHRIIRIQRVKCKDLKDIVSKVTIISECNAKEWTRLCFHVQDLNGIKVLQHLDKHGKLSQISLTNEENITVTSLLRPLFKHLPPESEWDNVSTIYTQDHQFSVKGGLGLKVSTGEDGKWDIYFGHFNLLGDRIGHALRTWYRTDDSKSTPGKYHFIGEYLDDNQHGFGSVTLPDGVHFKGEWKNGHRDGACCETFPNGEVYKGGFRRGNRNGPGVLMKKDGTVLSGEWVDGILLK